MYRNRSRRRGYTFVEIMVVTAIIGILFALLLPAVQAAREASRRSNCAANLVQLIVASHHYETYYGVFPPGTIDSQGPIQSLPRGYHHNWIVQILPYLEEKNTYAHIDRGAGVYELSNSAVRQLTLPILACPTQWRPVSAYGDYAGVHHNFEAPIDESNGGVFFLNSRVTYFDVADGTSQTLFIGEKITAKGDLGWMSGTRATLRNTGLRIYSERTPPPPPERLPPGFPDVDEAYLESMPEGLELYESVYGVRNTLFVPQGSESARFEYTPRDDAFNRWQGLGTRSTVRAGMEGDPALFVGGFGSMHPGGAQFAFGDGSVRFLDDTIHPSTYTALGNRADGRLLFGDW